MLKSTVPYTSKSIWSPYGFDKAEVVIPLRLLEKTTETREFPMSPGLRAVSQGKNLRVSPYGQISLAKDQWNTNGRKFVAEFLGQKWKSLTPDYKIRNYLDNATLGQFCNRVEFNSDELVSFQIDRIIFLLQESLEVAGLYDSISWLPGCKARTLEICKDFFLPVEERELESLLRRAASSIEGEAFDIGQRRRSSAVYFFFKWDADAVQEFLRRRSTQRILKVYPKPHGGIRLELQLKNYKFKEAIPGRAPLEELRAQLTEVATAMLDYLKKVEAQLDALSPLLNDIEGAEFRKVLALFVDDIDSPSGEGCFKLLTSGDETYTPSRHLSPISTSERKRLTNPNFGICTVEMKSGRLSLKRRPDWRDQGAKFVAHLEQKRERQREAQLQSRRKKVEKEHPQNPLSQPLSRRDFLRGTFFRYFFK